MVPGPQNLQAKAEADVASHGSKSGFISTSHSSKGYVLGPAIPLPLTSPSFFPGYPTLSVRERLSQYYLTIQVQKVSPLALFRLLQSVKWRTGFFVTPVWLEAKKAERRNKQELSCTTPHPVLTSAQTRPRSCDK